MDNNLKNVSILLVDDNPQNLQVLTGVLREKYNKLFIATDGYMALEIIDKNLPDLILLDIMMPDFSGYDVCLTIKQNPKTKDIPIIFLTALVKEEEIIKGFELGGVDYITKPFRNDELLARIETHLELKTSRDLIVKQNFELNQKNIELQHLTKLSEEQNKELKQLNATKDKFFSIIAHDLKNPIAAFIMLTKKTVRDFTTMSMEEINSIINSLYESSEHLNNLLSNLLNWATLNTGRMDFRPSEFNFFDLVNHVQFILKHYLYDKKLTFIAKIDTFSSVYADYDMMKSLLINLISNAIKFSYEGGAITVGIIDKGDEQEVYVNDTGVGIDKEVIQKLFKIDTIHKSLGTKNEKGTGLGLILCNDFVKRHNGRIWVDSEPGKGSSFRFVLPGQKD